MDIREFYKGKNILITGVTGYVGKAVAEKLLRSCDVGKIFLLIRSRPKITVSQRLDRIKASVVFDVLKEEKPNEIDKLIAIAGDLSQDGLGLIPDDKQLLTDLVHVVLHSAASLELFSDMKELIDANLCGTRRLLTVASEFKNIQVFVYVSTAFVHPRTSGGELMREVPMSITYSEEELMLTVTRLNKDERKRIAPLVMGGFGDWYTASKAYAEQAVSEERHFPCVIVRPSSVSSAWKEPYAGFHDSHNSYPGILRGAYTGVIRRSIVQQAIDLIPIDVVANAIIASGWKTAIEKTNGLLIYQATAGPFLHQHSYPQQTNSFIHDYPSKQAVWYPNLRFHKRFDCLLVSMFFYQFLPGLLFDLMLRLSGKRPVFVALYKKFVGVMQAIRQFNSQKYRFSVDNLLALHKQLSEEERLIFYLNIQDMNWEKYFLDMISGVRRCLLKESHGDLKGARRKNQILRVLSIFVEGAFHSFLWWSASIAFGLPLAPLVWVPVLTYCIFTFVL